MKLSEIIRRSQGASPFDADQAPKHVEDDPMQFKYKGFLVDAHQDSDEFWWINYVPELPTELDGRYNKSPKLHDVPKKAKEAIDKFFAQGGKLKEAYDFDDSDNRAAALVVLLKKEGFKDSGDVQMDNLTHYSRARQFTKDEDKLEVEVILSGEEWDLRIGRKGAVNKVQYAKGQGARKLGQYLKGKLKKEIVAKAKEIERHQ